MRNQGLAPTYLTVDNQG